LLLLLLLVNSCCLAFSPSSLVCQGGRKKCILREGEEEEDQEQPQPPPNFALDPNSESAKDILQNHLGLTQGQHDQLTALAKLVVEWNKNINLVSRKDCTVEVVFGRHILPSLALLDTTTTSVLFEDGSKVVDIGTGGGFPGLPLAIARPNVDFVLVDSVGKKLKVVDQIAASLSLDNLVTHHGRGEEMVDIIGRTTHKNTYDVCVGRSVTSIPKFCFWIQHLLRPKGGKLMYIIGGDIDDDILDRTEASSTIDDLLQQEGVSDKRILVLPQSEVHAIAAMSGEKRRIHNKPKSLSSGNKPKRKTKGAWEKRDNSVPKQRGYENFKRYSSN